MFSETLRLGRPIDSRFRLLSEATVLASALYLSGFIIAGQALLPLLFGANYAGLGAVTGWLAAMWALRMIQAVPGMALMAKGLTKPFAVAGFIRAGALPFALYAAWHGQPIATIAAIGCLFELNSLLYIAACSEKLAYGLGRGLVWRALFLVPVAIASWLIAAIAPAGTAMVLLAALSMMMLACATALVVMPMLRAEVRRLIAGPAAAPGPA
jgi:O-antigen/teichoic acid export membrane protein